MPQCHDVKAPSGINTVDRVVSAVCGPIGATISGVLADEPPQVGVIVPRPHVDQPGLRVADVPQAADKALLGRSRPRVSPHRPVHVVLGARGQIPQRVHLADYAPQPVVDVPAGLAERVPLPVRLRLRVVPPVARPARPLEVGRRHRRRSQTPARSVALAYHHRAVVGVVGRHSVRRLLAAQAVRRVLVGGRVAANDAAHQAVLAVPEVRPPVARERVAVGVVLEARGPRPARREQHVGRVVNGA